MNESVNTLFVQNRLIATVSAAKNPCSELPIVLIHGWGNSSSTWESIAAELNQHHDLIFIDLPGIGRNADVVIDTLSDLIKQLSALLPPQCYLVGWSLGGMLATRLALEFPHQVVKLITLATNPSFVVRDNWQPAMSRLTFEQFFHGFKQAPPQALKRFYSLQILGDKQRSRILPLLQQQKLPLHSQQFETWKTLLALLKEIDNSSNITSISQQCLHILGEKDALIPITVATRITQAGNQHQVRIVADVGHAIHLSKPVEVAAQIIDFFSNGTKKFYRKKADIARSFGQVADRYENAATLQKKTAHKLVALHQNFDGKIVDLGCGTGYCSSLIKSKKNEIFALDIAREMVTTGRKHRTKQAVWLQADMEQLPFADHSITGIISNMSVQWANDLSLVLFESNRILNGGGWFLFSTLGPRTLFELNHAWQHIDHFVHVNQFNSDREINALAANNQFDIIEKIISTETLYFPNVIELMRDIKAIGAHNINPGQNPGLTGRTKLRLLAEAYEPFRNREGFLPATYEVIYFLLRKRRD